MPDNLLDLIKARPDSIQFNDVINFIEQHYQYTPCTFSNGLGEDKVINQAGSNEGSCKIFAFARINQLDDIQTLNCFGDYYRVDVLQHPDATDHANIRNFMKYGWDGIQFEVNALTPL